MCTPTNLVATIDRMGNRNDCCEATIQKRLHVSKGNRSRLLNTTWQIVATHIVQICACEHKLAVVLIHKLQGAVHDHFGTATGAARRWR